MAKAKCPRQNIRQKACSDTCTLHTWALWVRGTASIVHWVFSFHWSAYGWLVCFQPYKQVQQPVARRNFTELHNIQRNVSFCPFWNNHLPVSSDTPLHTLMCRRTAINPSLFTIFITPCLSVQIASIISSPDVFPVSSSSDRSSSIFYSCCPSLDLFPVWCILYEMGCTRNAYYYKVP